MRAISGGLAVLSLTVVILLTTPATVASPTYAKVLRPPTGLRSWYGGGLNAFNSSDCHGSESGVGPSFDLTNGRFSANGSAYAQPCGTKRSEIGVSGYVVVYSSNFSVSATRSYNLTGQWSGLLYLNQSVFTNRSGKTTISRLYTTSAVFLTYSVRAAVNGTTISSTQFGLTPPGEVDGARHSRISFNAVPALKVSLLSRTTYWVQIEIQVSVEASAPFSATAGAYSEAWLATSASGIDLRAIQLA